MTLILAMKCKDGMILTSDSQSTFSTSGQPVKKTTNKLHELCYSIAWAASGAVGVAQRASDALNTNNALSYHKTKNFIELRKKLYGIVVPAVKEVYGNFVTFNKNPQPPNTGFLFCGYCGGKPFLYEIGHEMTDVEHTSVGFAAIGSGDIYPYHSQTMLAHYNVSQRTMLEGQLISYRIVDDAIQTAAFGLGPPVQMIVIAEPESDGSNSRSHRLTDDEIRILGDKVREWKQVEADALDEFIGIRPAEVVEKEGAHEEPVGFNAHSGEPDTAAGPST